MLGEVADQRIIVAGAASGIGRATAIAFAQAGAQVMALDLDADGLERLDDELDATSFAGRHTVDVSDAGSVATAFDAAVTTLGQIDALVNCVGITGETGKPTHDVDVDDFDRVYRANLRGALLLSQAAVRAMLPHHYGRILHLASIAGKEGNAGMAAYSATKAGLIGLVKTLGKDYATTGIVINALAPAVIQTPLVERMPKAQVDYMVNKIPMQRLGTLSEAVNVIAFAVSPNCSFTTGFTFDMSGGRSVY